MHVEPTEDGGSNTDESAEAALAGSAAEIASSGENAGVHPFLLPQQQQEDSGVRPCIGTTAECLAEVLRQLGLHEYSAALQRDGWTDACLRTLSHHELDVVATYVNMKPAHIRKFTRHYGMLIKVRKGMV